jgi:hypothetical protein
MAPDETIIIKPLLAVEVRDVSSIALIIKLATEFEIIWLDQ